MAFNSSILYTLGSITQETKNLSSPKEPSPDPSPKETTLHTPNTTNSPKLDTTIRSSPSMSAPLQPSPVSPPSLLSRGGSPSSSAPLPTGGSTAPTKSTDFQWSLAGHTVVLSALSALVAHFAYDHKDAQIGLLVLTIMVILYFLLVAGLLQAAALDSGLGFGAPVFVLGAGAVSMVVLQLMMLFKKIGRTPATIAAGLLPLVTVGGAALAFQYDMSSMLHTMT
jgi:hypothetical protein